MADDSSIEIKVDDPGDAFARVLAAIDAAKDNIPAQAKEAMMELGADLATRAAASVLGEPTHGTKHTGLRKRVAAGVGVTDIPGGARIITSMAKNDEAMIPRGFDTSATKLGWRHPLFGHEPWYRNFGGFSWFLGTMSTGDDEGEAKLKDALDQVAETIARSGS